MEGLVIFSRRTTDTRSSERLSRLGTGFAGRRHRLPREAGCQELALRGRCRPAQAPVRRRRVLRRIIRAATRPRLRRVRESRLDWLGPGPQAYACFGLPKVKAAHRQQPPVNVAGCGNTALVLIRRCRSLLLPMVSGRTAKRLVPETPSCGERPGQQRRFRAPAGVNSTSALAARAGATPREGGGAAVANSRLCTGLLRYGAAAGAPLFEALSSTARKKLLGRTGSTRRRLSAPSRGCTTLAGRRWPW